MANELFRAFETPCNNVWFRSSVFNTALLSGCPNSFPPKNSLTEYLYLICITSEYLKVVSYPFANKNFINNFSVESC